MSKNKVKITICGTEYNVLSEDNQKYIMEIGKEVDSKMNDILNKNSKLSTTMAAILVSLDYCDVANKRKCAIEKMKRDSENGCLSSNKENSTKYSLEINFLEKEIERLNQKIKVISKENISLIQKVSSGELEIQNLLMEKKEKEEKHNSNEMDYGEDILNFFDFQKTANIL